MSIPDDPGPNDDLFAQLSDLEVPSEDANVRLLSDYDLMVQFNAVRQELIDTGEMMEPKTQAGRELHSRRAALLIEQRRRQTEGNK